MKKYLLWMTILIICISMVVGFSLAGCKTTTAAETTAAATTAAVTTAAETTAAETTAAAKKVEYKLVMWWPVPHPFLELLKKGLAQFEKDYGIKVDVSVGTKGDIDEELQMLSALAAQGYNGIMAFPRDSTAINAAYKELIDKGIVAINYCAPVNEPTPVPFTVATNVKNQGVLATEKVIEAMGGKGNIVDILENLQDPNTALRKAGVEEAVAKHPDVKIIQEIAGLLNLDDSTSKITDVMAALGDKINGMVTTGVNPTIALSQIMTERKNSKIAYVGCDVDEVTAKAIKDGYVTGSFAQNPYCIAYTSALLTKLLLDGYTPKDKYTFIDAGGLIVTKDSVDGYDPLLWDLQKKNADEVLNYLNPPSK
jgi:ribose transport system substrate-binding protein